MLINRSGPSPARRLTAAPSPHPNRIEGYFPAARYFSFETLDASLKLVSYLCDVDIRPLGNVSNPFSSVLGDEGRTEQGQ